MNRRTFGHQIQRARKLTKPRAAYAQGLYASDISSAEIERRFQVAKARIQRRSAEERSQ